MVVEQSTTQNEGLGLDVGLKLILCYIMVLEHHTLCHSTVSVFCVPWILELKGK